MPRKSQASILANNLVEDGRWFYLSWWPEAAGSPSEGASLACVENLERRLRQPFDLQQCPIKDVVRRKTCQAQDAGMAAGAPVVAGGNQPWTDFVAVLHSEYVNLNRADPEADAAAPPGGLGDLALAISQLQRASADAAGTDPGQGSGHRLWLAVVERGGWRHLYVADRPLGNVDGLRVLLNDLKAIGAPVPMGVQLPREQRIEREKVEHIATSPKPMFERHLSAALDQLLDPPARAAGPTAGGP